MFFFLDGGKVELSCLNLVVKSCSDRLWEGETLVLFKSLLSFC